LVCSQLLVTFLSRVIQPTDGTASSWMADCRESTAKVSGSVKATKKKN
jgi:hypothetical protein